VIASLSVVLPKFNLTKLKLSKFNLTKLKLEFLSLALSATMKDIKAGEKNVALLDFDFFRVQLKFAFRLRSLKHLFNKVFKYLNCPVIKQCIVL